MVVPIVIGCILAAVAAVCAWGAWENTAVRLDRVVVEDADLPAAFHGFTLLHLSDLHNARFGKGQKKLLDLIASAAPDAIVVTGDLIDKRRPGMAHALELLSQAVNIAPVYYVTGNHEAVSREYPALRRRLAALGVHLLNDRTQTLRRGRDRLVLAGLEDPMFTAGQDAARNAAVAEERLRALLTDKAAYTVLLSHRPELFGVYCAAGVRLALCGHAHGGQFRLPWGQGIVAPNQGLFPKYTQGLYVTEGGKMVVSRGLGNSSVPIRLNNRPQAVAVTLKKMT